VKKLTVRVDDNFHKRLRLHCIEVGETVQAMVLRLLREELARAKKKGGRQHG